jgi:hypothetical protein
MRATKKEEKEKLITFLLNFRTPCNHQRVFSSTQCATQCSSPVPLSISQLLISVMAAAAAVAAPASERNVGIHHQKAKQFGELIKKYRLLEEPMPLQPDVVGISPDNRKVNLKYVHGLASQIKREGFDPSRPRVGYVVQLTQSDDVKRLIDFNVAESQAQPELWPPILKDKMSYACLGGNHLTVALRLFKHGAGGQTAGDEGGVCDEALAAVVQTGHKYVILKDQILKDDPRNASFIASWLNSDQNENQGNNEAELMKVCQQTVRTLLQTTPQLKMSIVVAKIVQESVVKLNPNAVGSLVRWVMEAGVDTYVDSLLAYHSNFVNPTDLSCSPNWFEEVCKAVPKENVLFRLNLAIIQYNPEVVDLKLRPQPDACRFISLPDLAALKKKQEVVQECEKFMATNRRLLEKELLSRTSKAAAENYFRLLETNVVRLALQKPLHKQFPAGIMGKFEGTDWETTATTAQR